MPVSWTAILRLVVLLLMAAHVFYLYAFARTLQEIVGPDVPTILASSSFALVMMVPLVWAVVLPDLPQIVRTHRDRGRWLQGRCSRCGYFVLQSEGNSCPECGTDRREPGSFRFGWPTVRRFGFLAATAWLVGCLAAECWAEVDEATFAREAAAEVNATVASHYTRPRRWPMQDKTLYFSSTDGVTAFSPEFLLIGAGLGPSEKTSRPD